MATDLVQEQCDAEADTSIQQRVLMGAGTAIQGTGGALCEDGEGNEDMMIAGGKTYLSLQPIYIIVATVTEDNFGYVRKQLAACNQRLCPWCSGRDSTEMLINVIVM